MCVYKYIYVYIFFIFFTIFKYCLWLAKSTADDVYRNVYFSLEHLCVNKLLHFVLS